MFLKSSFCSWQGGDQIVRVDELAFTVLYYDGDQSRPLGVREVPQRWQSLTTAPLQLSASVSRGSDGTDQVWYPSFFFDFFKIVFSAPKV